VKDQHLVAACSKTARARWTHGVVPPNIVAPTKGRSPAASGARFRTIPAMAAAALFRMLRLMRLIPAMSTTELNIRMSLSPAYCRTWPEPSVLAIS